MSVRELTSQFTIYVHSDNLDQGAGLKVALAQNGYDTQFVETFDLLTSRFAQKPAHVLVFSVASVKGSISDFFEALLKINSEIRFIAITRPENFVALTAYAEHGLADIVTDEGSGLSARICFAVDRVCEKLYSQYQNEHLVDEVERLAALKTRQESLLQDREQRLARQSPPLDGRIKDYVSAESPENLLSLFIDHVKDAPCVYLRYLPSVRSLVAVVASGFSTSDIQGVGCQITPEEARDFGSQVALGLVVPSLQTLLEQAFRFPTVRLRPLFVRGRLEGILAFSGGLEPGLKAELEDEFSLMALIYEKVSLEQRIDLLEIRDPVTEVYNTRFYQTRIREEWDRAKREQRPLSLLKIALDDFYELDQTLGEATRDELLKKLVRSIKMGSRTFDVLCRTAHNEFSLLLPNCEKQGAMIRAERLRRFIESSQMLENGLKISISVGISEYPSLCNSAEDLDQTANKALLHIMDKGGNRLCLFKAPADHRAEFTVTVPTPEQV